MNSTKPIYRWFGAVAIAILVGASASSASAVQPDVKTVPWVAANPLIPHTTVVGKSIRLKGTANVQGANFQYSWDFGDGTPVSTGPVTNQYAIEASHIYAGSVGDVFTAQLTVQDTNTGETDSATYFVQIQADTLESRVNIAIDEGLWYLHKTMRRYDEAGMATGDWVQSTSCGTFCASTTYYAGTPSNVLAFLVNGHLESSTATNPYTETVRRAVKGTFRLLTIPTIPTSQTNPLGTFNPNGDGDALGVSVNQVDPFYQGGMFMDAIVATGTPSALVTNGPFAGRADGTGPGGAWTYKDVVQDMADYYGYCQYDFAGGGGWRYSCNQFPDGSAVQWAAIGLIAAERNFGVVIPAIVKDWLKTWTDTAHDIATGISGYTGTSPIWGPFATTPSGTVQMVWTGIGRGNPLWDTSETYLRNTWCNAGTAATQNIKNYYYGLFSFTKSMLLHDANGDGTPEPITLLQSSTAGVTPTDWYAAEASKGDPCDGVARTLVNEQNAAGYWYANDFTGTQYPFETGWAIVMLNRTVFESGLPVAVAQAFPNPAVAGQIIQLDGSNSFHQDAARVVDSWEWDLDNDGQYDDANGPFPTVSFPAVGDYPVGLRVTDDGSPEQDDTTTVTVRVTTPPLPPTANAGGPYVFCPQNKPWFLDGTGSVNPDDGQSEPGLPGDFIQDYAWELNGGNGFDDATGAQPDVTAIYEGLGIGDYLAKLRVTDNTATSFPSSGQPDLTSIGTAEVSVKARTDVVCAGCVDDLVARPKSGKIQLTWADVLGDLDAVKYNIYRSTIDGGPYLKIAETISTYSTYLDRNVVNGTTYYYVVRPAKLNGNEVCQSNEATARARTR
jgi:hypothetical protein